MSKKRNKLYTKKGDDGSTSLIGGQRVSKSHVRVNAYGALDELNCLMGWIRTQASENDKYKTLVSRIQILQNQLFDLGAELACPPGQEWEGMKKVEQVMIEKLETWIDESSSKSPTLATFVLPGGTEINSRLHIARATCRRVERLVVEMSENEEVSSETVQYLNRLSDLLFAWARESSHTEGAKEYLWNNE